MLQPATKASSAGLPGGDVEAARAPLLLDVVLVVPVVPVVPVAPVAPVAPRVAVPASPGAPATAAVAPRAAPSDAPARAAAAVLATGVGRGPHKREVDLDGLVQQLGLMGAVDGCAGLGERGVLDQCVALLLHAKVVSSGQPACLPHTHTHTHTHRQPCWTVAGEESGSRRVPYLDVTAPAV